MRRTGHMLALWAALSCSPVLAQSERTTIKQLRFEEDWRSLCEPANRTQPLDRLKCLPLGDEAALTLGGEYRARYEAVRNPLFGLIDRGSDDALLQRVLLQADLRFGETARVFVQLGDHRATRRDFGRIPTDVDRIDLQQGFVDVGTKRGTLRVGRQELDFGSARLVSAREGPNVRRAFDGGRIIGTVGSARVEAFYVRPVTLSPRSFDDASDRAQNFRGVYGSAFPVPWTGAKLDLYYLDLSRERATFAAGTAREERRSVGGRLFGKSGAFDYDFEGVYQFGAFGRNRIRAWTAASDSGVTFASLPLAPRLGLKADIASGDGDLRDDELGTFNALFPKLPYFTEATLIAPSNVMDLQPSVTVRPDAKVAVIFGWDVLWRHRVTDAYYAPPLMAVPRTAGTPRFLGHQLSLRATWQATPRLSFVGEAVHFEPGEGLEALGGEDGDFVVVSTSARF